jgi:hypothetical protein
MPRPVTPPVRTPPVFYDSSVFDYLLFIYLMDIVTALDNYILQVSGPREPSNNSPMSLPLPLTPSRSSERRSHSQTVPYPQHEPAKSITDQAEKQKFLDHLFPGNDASAQQELDFSDLRYDSAQPGKAETAVSERLNKLISSSSKSASSSLN